MTEEPRCTLKPPLKLVSATQYRAPKHVRLPVVHQGRTFVRTPKKKLIATDEATGEVLWENADPCIGRPKVIWQGRLVGAYMEKRRGEPDEEPGGLALIDVETGEIERVVEYASAEVAVGSTLLESLPEVSALDFETGKTIWRWDPGPDLFLRSSLAVDGRSVYFGLSDGSVLALDLKTGRELWRASVADLYERAEAKHLAVLGGFLVGSDAASWVVGFRVDDGTRAWVWRREVSSGEAYAYGGLYHVLSWGRLVTLEPATGRVVSDYDLTRSLPKEIRFVIPTNPFLVSDTHVFTGSGYGAVLAFERETGKYAWHLKPKGAESTSYFAYNDRFAVGDKRLYYWDASLRVYCLAEDEAAEVKPVAKKVEKRAAKKSAAGKATAKKPAGAKRRKEAVRSVRG